MIDFETLKLGDKVFRIVAETSWPEKQTFIDENKVVWYRNVYKQKYFVEEIEFVGKVEFAITGEISDEFDEYDQTKYFFKIEENVIMSVYIEDACDIFYTINEANEKASELEKNHQSRI